VIGFGRLGRACAEAIATSDDLRLAGFVRRAERLGASLPMFREVPVSADVAELDAVDAALLCLPSPMVTATAHDLLQHGLPTVECAALDGAVFRRRKERLDRLAQRQHRRPRRDPWSCRELRPVSWLGLS
jgi:diaminopimelate dehydrogenase